MTALVEYGSRCWYQATNFYSVLIVRSASWLKLKSSHFRNCCEENFNCDRLRKSTTVESTRWRHRMKFHENCHPVMKSWLLPWSDLYKPLTLNWRETSPWIYHTTQNISTSVSEDKMQGFRNWPIQTLLPLHIKWLTSSNYPTALKSLHHFTSCIMLFFRECPWRNCPRISRSAS